MDEFPVFSSKLLNIRSMSNVSLIFCFGFKSENTFLTKTAKSNAGKLGDYRI